MVMSELAKRVATAAVLVPLVLLALFFDPTVWSVLGFTLVVAVLATDEFLRMSLRVSHEQRCVGLRVTSSACNVFMVAIVCWVGIDRGLPPAIMVAMVVVAIAALARARQVSDAGQQLAACLAVVVYVGVLVSVWPPLKQGVRGSAWLAITVSIAFVSDTLAYFAGRAFGRHLLYPAVSPKKTWEGGVGGLLGGVLATLGLGTAWLVPELSVRDAIVLGVLGSAFGQVGDLVESMIKRSYGVKDSGRLLPGHGGMLDRIDGLLFVAPVVYWYITFIVH